MQRRTSIWIALIIVVVLVAAISLFVIMKPKSNPSPTTPKSAVEAAQQLFSPVNDCHATKTAVQPNDPDFPEIQYSVLINVACSTRTASLLDIQLANQYKNLGYSKIGVGAPQWGCFQTTSGSTTCLDNINAQKGSITERAAVTIHDSAAEADDTLGTEDYLSQKSVTGYNLTISSVSSSN